MDACLASVPPTIVMLMTSYTFRNGQMVEVPDTVVTEDTDFHDSISNTLVIHPGITATTFANVSGTVRVMAGAAFDARGAVSGTVTVDAGAVATFHSVANGSIHVSDQGLAHLLPGAIALGTMRIDGRLINEGVRGVNVSGVGFVEDREGSSVRRPTRTLSDGTTVYED
jgi:hypothetical protein